MHIAKKLLIWFMGTIAALALLIAMGIAVMGWESIWEKTAGPADQGPVDFATLTKTPKPNQALICPDGFCKAAEAANQVDRKSPTYTLSAEALAAQLLETLQQENNLERVDKGSDPNKLRFVQRTAGLKFPDTIRVEIIPIDQQRSTMALYSQSQIGISDRGVNAKRLSRWLKRLQTFEADE